MGRFTVVDALRGVAAMSVVLFHSSAYIPLLLASLPEFVRIVLFQGSLGVPVFFVLSGFVIAHSLFGKPMTASEFGRFTLKRSLRLDPPYWASIVLVMSFEALATYVVVGKQLPQYTTPQVLAHLVYLQDILDLEAINGVYWTLCLEFQFYLSYALILMAAKSNPPAWIVAACAFSLLWPLGIGPEMSTNDETLLPQSFPPLWHAFLAGALAYWAWRKPTLAVPFWAFAVVLILSALIRQEWFTLTSGVIAVVLYVAAITDWIRLGLNWRWLQFLGLVSYSLYLTHILATRAVFRTGLMLSEPSAWTELLWWIASLMGCVILASMFWWALERPSLAWSKRVGKMPIAWGWAREAPR